MTARKKCAGVLTPPASVPMDTQETLETIGELVDKINSLKVQIEDELSMLDCDSDEYNALQEYVDALDSAETELSENIKLPNCNWMI